MITSRRNFLRGAVASAALAPTIGFPAVVKMRRPNELLSHACIGTGHMALGDLKGLMSHRDIHITALCDVDSTYLAAAKKLCPDAHVYRDAFEMLACEGTGIDSVNVSTPDHTHAQYVTEALRRGLNVYGQKPLCHYLSECRQIEQLAAEKKAITQMGTQIVAWECDRRTAAALKAGTIGEVKHIWIYSIRRREKDFDAEKMAWPRSADPVPPTLDWKLWLGPAKYRPYSENTYHPFIWRRFKDFGSSWLGDLALHLMSPVWIGLDLQNVSPESVVAEISADETWTNEQREQFWPTNSHVTWTFPGVKASGGKPFDVEWCDGFYDVEFKSEPKFYPPAFLQDIAAQTPLKALPHQARIVEGTEGWLISTHYGIEPYFVMKDGSTPPQAPQVGTGPSHWHQYIDSCLTGVETYSPFSWTVRLTETSLIANEAMLRPGKKLYWNREKGILA